ncbi:MAG: hypothetical protein GY830_11320 [Bacteroidetes bacterium]|nr:hypothetical protein [Bacteroidota bacterium]
MKILKLLLLINILLITNGCGKPTNNNSSNNSQSDIKAYEKSLEGKSLAQLEAEEGKLLKENLSTEELAIKIPTI